MDVGSGHRVPCAKGIAAARPVTAIEPLGHRRTAESGDTAIIRRVYRSSEFLSLVGKAGNALKDTWSVVALLARLQKHLALFRRVGPHLDLRVTEAYGECSVVAGIDVGVRP